MRPAKFIAFRRLLWLSERPEATAEGLAAVKEFHVSVEAARKWLDSQARRGLVERRVTYRVRDSVRL